jgi:hypothetical protein
MSAGFIFFSGAIPAYACSAVGVLFGQGMRAALFGLFVGVTLSLILLVTLN